MPCHIRLLLPVFCSWEEGISIIPQEHAQSLDSLSPNRKPAPRELAAVAIISAAVLGFELALMRTLSISRWHHFAYLIVGLALLGFGASGTWLGLMSSRMVLHFSTWSRTLTLVLALSITICYRLAETLPLNMKYILFSGQQLFYLLCYQLLIFLPFLVAGVNGLPSDVIPAPTATTCFGYGSDAPGGWCGHASWGLRRFLVYCGACGGIVAWGVRCG